MAPSEPQPSVDNLTDKQRAFVLEYVKDWNATQAAIRAGYAESGARTEGHRLLANADIRAEIDLHLADMGITADRILAEQAAIAFGDMGDFLEISAGGGLTLKDGADLTGKTKLIRKLKEKRKILTKAEGDGEEMIIDSQVEVELYDRQKAFDALAKHTSGRERISPPTIQHTADPANAPAQQIVALMSSIITHSQQGTLDPKLAASMSSIAAVLLKANEQGELETRLKALENLHSGGQQDDLGLDFE